MSLHSHTQSWFRSNQYLSLLLSAANTYIIGLTVHGLEPIIYRTWAEHGNNYTNEDCH